MSILLNILQNLQILQLKDFKVRIQLALRLLLSHTSAANMKSLVLVISLIIVGTAFSEYIEDENEPKLRVDPQTIREGKGKFDFHLIINSF